MRRSTGAFVIGLTLLTQATAAVALGFGRIGNATQLGQPLDFSVVLTAEGNDLIGPQCVVAEVSAGDSLLPSTQVRTRLDTPADGGPLLLHVATSVRIDEPVVSVNVALGCPVRVSRRFVVFVDPPLLVAPPTLALPAAEPAASSAAGSMAELTVPPASARRASGVTDSVGAVAVAASAPRRVRPASGPHGRAVAASTGADAAPARRVSSAVAAPNRAAGLAAGRGGSSAAVAAVRPAAPRLKLEADWQPLRTGTAEAAAAAALAGGAAPPLPGRPLAIDAAPGVNAQAGTETGAERQRIRQLEQNIDKLLAEARATQASLADMRTRLRNAESAGSPWTYGLLALVALLLAAVLALLWRQSRLKRESAWWAGGTEADLTMAAPLSAPADELAAPPPSVAVDALPTLPGADADAVEAPPIAPPQRFVVAQEPVSAAAPAAFDPFTTQAGDSLRDLSVEALIDMEQQVEFFIVLGQDDAAIELLTGHVRQGHNDSPLAFLKLLEIYHRRDDRAAYQKLRERFSRRFGAAAPEWDALATANRPLEAYPEVAARLQAVWPDPVQAMWLLDALLFRRDVDTAVLDLPAYTELLFLYSQARELAESAVPTDTVDLLLPIGEDTVSSAPPSTLSEPLSLTVQPLQAPAPTPAPGAAPSAEQPVSIDLDLEAFTLPSTTSRR